MKLFESAKMFRHGSTLNRILSTLNFQNWKTVVYFIAAFCFLSFGLSNQFILHLTTIYGAYKILEYLVTQIIKDLN